MINPSKEGSGFSQELHRLADAIDDGVSLDVIAEQVRKSGLSYQSDNQFIVGIVEGQLGMLIAGLYARFMSVGGQQIDPEDIEADRKLFRDAISGLTTVILQTSRSQRQNALTNYLHFWASLSGRAFDILIIILLCIVIYQLWTP